MAIARTRSRTAGRRASSTTRARDIPITVKFAIMGNGVFPQCVRRGSTIGELFKQAGFDARKSLTKGAVIRLDGRNVDANAVITRDKSVVTSTSAVKGATAKGGR